MSSNVLQGSTKESIEPRSRLHLCLGGVKVIRKFTDQAPKTSLFWGILPLLGSFLGCFVARLARLCRHTVLFWDFWVCQSSLWRLSCPLAAFSELNRLFWALPWEFLHCSRLQNGLTGLVFENICTVGTRTTLLDRLFLGALAPSWRIFALFTREQLFQTDHLGSHVRFFVPVVRVTLSQLDIFGMFEPISGNLCTVDTRTTCSSGAFGLFYENLCTVDTRTSFPNGLYRASRCHIGESLHCSRAHKFSKRALWPQLRESLYRWHAYNLPERSKWGSSTRSWTIFALFTSAQLFVNEELRSSMRIFVPVVRVQAILFRKRYRDNDTHPALMVCIVLW